MTERTNMGEERLAERRGYQGVWLMIIISALLCLGALMVFSAGASVDQQIDLRRFWKYATMRRVAFVPIVWVVLAIASCFNYRRWVVNERNFWLSPILYLLLFSVVMLGLVLIPGIGTEVNQSRRWLRFGAGEYSFTFQPSEMAKWCTVMFLAGYAVHRKEKIRWFWGGFVPACAVLMMVVGLIGVEDFGTAALVGAMGVVVLLVGGVRWWHLLVLIPLAAVAFYFLVYCNDYRWSRVLAYWHGSDGTNEMASAYHAQQSIMAIGAGGIWGLGLGNGTIKFGWVPEDTTDFVFAVISEELGLVGCGIVIGLFILLLVCSIFIIRRAPDALGKLLGVAIAGMIGAQAVMNLMVVSGLAPTKGIALPFVSAGGTGLVITAVATGVLVNIARQGRIE